MSSTEEESAAALRIQSVHRGRAARARVSSMKSASSLSEEAEKQAGHDNVTPSVPAMGVPDGKSDFDDAQVAAATKIQAAQRAKKARMDVSEMKQQKAAATKIQSVQRGKQARKEVAAMRVGTADATPEAETTAPAAEDTPAAPAAEELIAAANEAELEEAATKIQAMHRGRVARKQTNAMRGKGGPSDIEMDQETLLAATEAEERAAVKIQSVQRGRQARRDYAEKVAAASEGPQKEQVVMGSLAVEVDLVEFTEEQTVAAVRIQAVARGRQARNDVTKLREEKELTEAATRIQSVHRGRQARKTVAQVRSEQHAGFSQEEAEAACTINKHFRGFKARKEVADMREAMRMQITEEAREMMSTRIEHTTMSFLAKSTRALEAELLAKLDDKDKPKTFTESKARVALACHVARVNALGAVLKMAKIEPALATLIITGQQLPKGRELALQVARHTARDNVRAEWTEAHVAAMLTAATGLWQYEQMVVDRAITGARMLKLNFHCLPMLGCNQWDHMKPIWAFMKTVQDFCVTELEFIPCVLDWQALVEF